MTKKLNAIDGLRTAESVSPKHPDKMCDRISDAVLDAYLELDADARVAVEAVGGHGKVFVVGEVTSHSHVDVAPIVERIVGDVELEIRLVEQSHEIARGVDTGGAGDQGIMVGYACSETPQGLPLEVVLARSLNQYLYELWPYDGKTQVTLRGNEIESIVASFQNAKTDSLEVAVHDWIGSQSYVGVKANKTKKSDPIFHINPTGDWEQGGFEADTGLTGRKLVVDNYGPRIPVGGGAFSGKDASKVDRSGAYMARKIARDYLERFNAHKVFVRLAYSIGVAEPLEATAIVDGKEHVVDGYDLTPLGITKLLDLKKPIFEKTASYGHFGHDDFPWEH
jgi:S-adenosylmethionine synthetase